MILKEDLGGIIKMVFFHCKPGVVEDELQWKAFKN